LILKVEINFNYECCSINYLYKNPVTLGHSNTTLSEMHLANDRLTS
jgi:hypothetical protein